MSIDNSLGSTCEITAAKNSAPEVTTELSDLAVD
jgi:hypothetical protein